VSNSNLSVGPGLLGLIIVSVISLIWIYQHRPTRSTLIVMITLFIAPFSSVGALLVLLESRFETRLLLFDRSSIVAAVMVFSLSYYFSMKLMAALAGISSPEHITGVVASTWGRVIGSFAIAAMTIGYVVFGAYPVIDCEPQSRCGRIEHNHVVDALRT
jgi:hypothetical protein